MDVRPIRTEADYDSVLVEINSLMDAPDDDVESNDKLEVLSALVKVYEEQNYPIAPPSPIVLLNFVMEQRGLTRKDLARAIGSEAHVSNVLGGKRALSLSMIVRLNKLFGIPIAGLVDRKTRPKPRGRAASSSGRHGRAKARRAQSTAHRVSREDAKKKR